MDSMSTSSQYLHHADHPLHVDAGNDDGQALCSCSRNLAGAVVEWYCRWPSGLTLTASRGSTPPGPGRESWRGTQTKAQYNPPTGPYWPKGARNKKKLVFPQPKRHLPLGEGRLTPSVNEGWHLSGGIAAHVCASSVVYRRWRTDHAPLRSLLQGWTHPTRGTQHRLWPRRSSCDIQHCREQERDRGAAKTTAQKALEMSHVHRLAVLVTEKAELLKELAIRENRTKMKWRRLHGLQLPKQKRWHLYPPYHSEVQSSARCSWQSGDGSWCTGPQKEQSHTHSHMLRNVAGLRLLLLCLCLLHSRRRIFTTDHRPPLRPEDISLPPQPSHVRFAMKFSRSLPIFLMNGHWSRLTWFLIRQRHTTNLGVNSCTSMNDCALFMRVPQLAQSTKTRIAFWNTKCRSSVSGSIPIEPTKELTRVKEPDFLFLHDKDFWFRSISTDLHQALTTDRESSRDRAPRLVRCICYDDQVKGPNTPVKFKLSNILTLYQFGCPPQCSGIFDSLLKVHLSLKLASCFFFCERLSASTARSLQHSGPGGGRTAANSAPGPRPSTLPLHHRAGSEVGQLDYREGWNAIVLQEGKPGESLCGIQMHLSDNNLATLSWMAAIEHWAERGLLKPDVWRVRRTNLSFKIKTEIPVSGTSIRIQQHALQLDQLSGSQLQFGKWMDSQIWSAWHDLWGHVPASHTDPVHVRRISSGSDSYLFKWDTNVWDIWPQGYEHKFWGLGQRGPHLSSQAVVPTCHYLKERTSTNTWP